MPTKVNSNSKLFKDKIVQSKNSDVIRKRFLSDLSYQSDKFRSNAYDNLVNQIQKNGPKKNTALYNNIKSFLYGDSKQVTLKMIKSDVKETKLKNIESILPFSDDIYGSSNNSISSTKLKKVFPFSNDIFDAVNTSPTKVKDETVFTIYAKIKITTQANEGDKDSFVYQTLVNDRRGDDTEVWATERYSQFQFDVTGRNNIRNELKHQIDRIADFSYNIRVDVVNLSINKHIKMNKNEYRWEGVEKHYHNNKNDELFYYKAWDSEFQYFGYDLDINNETPYQCVDNAIVKMYGNRETSKRDGFLAWIADGGIDAVSQWFDGSEEEEEEDSLDFGINIKTTIQQYQKELLSNENKIDVHDKYFQTLLQYLINYVQNDKKQLDNCSNILAKHHKDSFFTENISPKHYSLILDSVINWFDQHNESLTINESKYYSEIISNLHDKIDINQIILFVSEMSSLAQLKKLNFQNCSDSIAKFQNELKQMKRSLNEELMSKYCPIIIKAVENILGIDETNVKPKPGRDSYQILNFCNENKIRCYGYDWKFNQFITNKNSDVKFNNNLPAFVFYFNDEHIYLINDSHIRQALLHKSDKLNIQSMLQKKQEIEDTIIDTSNLLIDIPFEDWSKYEKSTIYITKHRLINDIFYQEIAEGRIHNRKIKLSEKDGITKFQCHTNTIVYNPDIKAVLETLKQLDETKYKFQNQKLNTLAKEVLDKQFSGLPSSTMNKNGDAIFHSEFIRNCQYNGWFEMPESKNLVGYDYNKHYTSCLTQDIKYGFPIYSVFDEVEQYDGQILAGFFYVETSNSFPFRGNGWYDADLVEYGIESRIIQHQNIKFQYVSTRSLPTNYFKKFVKFVYENFTEPKDAINTFIGCLGHDYKNMNVHHFTSDARLVFREIVENQSAQVKNIYHKDFMNVEKEINIDTLNPTDYVNDIKPLCYHVFNNSRVHHFHNSLPIFYKVYNMSAIKMHQMASQVGGIVRGVFTDTIIFENAVNKPYCDASIIGGIREAPVKEFTKCMSTIPRKTEYKKLKDESLSLKPIEDFSLTAGKGCFFKGMGGTGKSYKVNETQKELKPEQFVVCTPTHKSALIVNGRTIYNAFDIDFHDHTYVRSSVQKMKAEGLEWVFVDEISMINSSLWGVIRDIKRNYGFKFVMSGDFGQLDPVESTIYDVEISEVFAEICDGQVLEFTKDWRAQNDPEYALFTQDKIKVRNSEKIDYKTYGQKECRKSIAWTNATRKVINLKWMTAEAKLNKHITINNVKVFKGLPLIANKTISIAQYCEPKEGVKKEKDVKNEVKNNEEFEVVSFTDNYIEIKNSRLSFQMKYESMKYFDLAYCITVHKAQGSTFNFEFSIYEYKRFDKKLLYTAMSRSTQKSFINFMPYCPATRRGCVYKISDDSGRVYIGSTLNSKKRWSQHRESNETDKFHTELRSKPDEWTFEVIEIIEFFDEETLLIAETTQIMKHNSILNGYNSKFPISIVDIY